MTSSRLGNKAPPKPQEPNNQSPKKIIQNIKQLTEKRKVLQAKMEAVEARFLTDSFAVMELLSHHPKNPPKGYVYPPEGQPLAANMAASKIERDKVNEDLQDLSQKIVDEHAILLQKLTPALPKDIAETILDMAFSTNAGR